MKIQTIQNNDWSIIKLHFASKNYKNINKPGYDLYLYAVIDKFNGLIYATKYDFKSFRMNLCTTKSWFDVNKNIQNFAYKSKILEVCVTNKKQIERINQNDSKIIDFDVNQLKKLNELLNENEVNTTIYNLNSITNGSNATGSDSSNKSSQTFLISDHTNTNYQVVVKIIDSLIVKNNELLHGMWDIKDLKKFKELSTDELDSLDELKNYVNTNKLALQSFLNENLDTNIKKIYYEEIFDVLNTDKISPNIKETIKRKIKNFSDIQLVNKILITKVNKKRQMVANIKPSLSFNFPETQKAHIYNVSWIKRDIEQDFYSQKTNKCLNAKEIDIFISSHPKLNWIDDSDNLFAMEIDIHAYFDKYFWIFDDNLSVYFILKNNSNQNNKQIYEKLTVLKNFRNNIKTDTFNISERTQQYVLERIKKVEEIIKNQANVNSKYDWEIEKRNWVILN
ncbi:HNH endonuclease [Mycoplasma sp. 1331]|uniref:HNH endonuclease n=2 Tax=Mycoplasma tauri TaxID=547987 RepID=A0A953T3Z7_9MOLU|nr:HNH endonuclease [Mycoplasma tauri]MBZ4195628.1 HNH endonuclease [Mycoplasma tauri]